MMHTAPSTADLRSAHDQYEAQWPHFTRCLRELRRQCGSDMTSNGSGLVDVHPLDPCPELIRFLNCWGCHIAKSTPANYMTATSSFSAWRREFEGRLPDTGARLTTRGALELWRDQVKIELGKDRSGSMAGAFDALRDALVADQDGYQRRFSDVATSKILYVLRPHLYLAWDNSIRDALKHQDDGESYFRFVLAAVETLIETDAERARHERSLADLQLETGCTALELLNKYYWMTVPRQSKTRQAHRSR